MSVIDLRQESGVLDKVLRWVGRTVCTFVVAVVDVVVDIVVGLVNIVIGVFTWDWARVWDGFLRLVGGIVEFVLTVVRILYLGDTVDFTSSPTYPPTVWPSGLIEEERTCRARGASEPTSRRRSWWR